MKSSSALHILFVILILFIFTGCALVKDTTTSAVNKGITVKDETKIKIVTSEQPVSKKIVTEKPVSNKIMTSEKPVSDVQDYSRLIKQINDYTKTQPGFYSIYFKDLDSGAVFDINGKEPITAASLVKVPAVLYLNALIDQGKLNWNDTVAYESHLDYQSGAPALCSFQPGTGMNIHCALWPIFQSRSATISPTG